MNFFFDEVTPASFNWNLTIRLHSDIIKVKAVGKAFRVWCIIRALATRGDAKRPMASPVSKILASFLYNTPENPFPEEG